jgi:hypothetical protein
MREKGVSVPALAILGSVFGVRNRKFGTCAVFAESFIDGSGGDSDALAFEVEVSLRHSSCVVNAEDGVGCPQIVFV